MRIKLNGTILESNNELVVEQWKKAGYAEVGNKSKQPTGEPLNSNEPLNDGESLKDGESLSDGEPQKGKKKAQE